MNLNSFTIKFDKDDLPWLEYAYVTDAAKKLNGAAFKLYIYFCAEITSGLEEITFSPSKYVQTCGGGITSARRAFQELIDAKYLTQIRDDCFIFSRETKMV